MELERCCGERARIILPAAKLVCSKMGLRKETLLVLELSAIRFWICTGRDWNFTTEVSFVLVAAPQVLQTRLRETSGQSAAHEFTMRRSTLRQKRN